MSSSGMTTEMILAIVVAITGTTTIFGIILLCVFAFRLNKPVVGGVFEPKIPSNQQESLQTQHHQLNKQKQAQQMINNQRQMVHRPIVATSFTLPTLTADSSTGAGTSSGSDKNNNTSRGSDKKKGSMAAGSPVETISSSTCYYEDDQDGDDEDYVYNIPLPSYKKRNVNKKKIQNTNFPKIRRFSSSSSSSASSSSMSDDSDGDHENSSENGDSGDDIRTATQNHFDDNWSLAMVSFGGKSLFLKYFLVVLTPCFL